VKSLNERQIGIDVFRGIAILLVTGYHVWRVIDRPHIYLEAGLERFDLLGFLAKGHTGVELFFVISGFCMATTAMKSFNDGYSFYTLKNYLIKRFLRIAVPYYAAILIWNVLIHFFNLTHKPHDTYHNLMHLLFLHTLTNDTFYSVSGVFWSIAVEMHFYLVLPVILIFAREKSHLLLLFIFSFLVSLVLNTRYPSSLIITHSILSYIPLFIFGIILSVYRDTLSRLLSPNPMRALLLLTSIAMISYRGTLFSGSGDLLGVITGFLFGALMISVMDLLNSLGSNFFVTLIAFIGKCSFSIYLYNYILYALNPGFPPILSFFILMLFVILTGVLMYYLVEEGNEYYRSRFLAYLTTIREKSSALTPKHSPP